MQLESVVHWLLLYMQIRALKLQAGPSAALSQPAQLFACCSTVASHMQQIRLWFTNNDDQSLDSVLQQLTRLSSGNFHIQLHQGAEVKATISIKYKIDTSADAVEQCLDEQGLTDLVKRLYLDQQDPASVPLAQDSSDQELKTFNGQIAAFLQLFQVHQQGANTILDTQYSHADTFVLLCVLTVTAMSIIGGCMASAQSVFMSL